MPTKAEQKLVNAAVNSFNARYASDENWGHDRWYGSLLPALNRPTRHAALVNKFVPKQAFDDLITTSKIDPIERLELPRICSNAQVPTTSLTVYVRPVTEDDKESLFPQPIRVPSGPQSLLSHWNLDAASLLCVHLLSVQPTDHILDLCAAPGGKSLAIAQLLFSTPTTSTSPPTIPVTASLHVNELDPQRNKRLTANLKFYLPATLFTTPPTAPSIQILNLDASQPRAHMRLPLSGTYDKVLLDAPCSSERHLLHSHLRASASGRAAVGSELVRWRPGQVKSVARTQAALLLTALRAVRVGGRVVYSTCSIERGENDGVVERVREMIVKGRKKGEVDFEVECLMGRALKSVAAGDETGEDWKELDDWSEETEYGRITLPDHASGGRWGPLFFCVMIKIPATT